MNNKKSTNIRIANLLLEERFFQKEIQELSPKSAGVQDFLDTVEKNPKSLPYLGFKTLLALKKHVSEIDNEDFHELVDELNVFLNKRKKKK